MSAQLQAVARPDARTLALDIEGMTCASCVNRIERFLRKTDGVVEANVNLATERASVVARPDVTLEQLIAAVEAAGYDARAMADAEPRRPSSRPTAEAAASSAPSASAPATSARTA